MLLKLGIYKFHMEPRNEEINANKIIAVNDATYEVEKRKSEKIWACPSLNFFRLSYMYFQLHKSHLLL